MLFMLKTKQKHKNLEFLCECWQLLSALAGLNIILKFVSLLFAEEGVIRDFKYSIYKYFMA